MSGRSRVTDGGSDAGTPRRHYVIVHGERRELVDRHLRVLYAPRSYCFRQARRFLHDFIEPTFDDDLAVRITPDRLATRLCRRRLKTDPPWSVEN
jgi:hypothetical protein